MARGRRRDRVSVRDHALGVVLALAAGLHKVLLASVLVNDDFMHRAYSRQLLAGEWPVRDFFDYGMGLMSAVSAAAQLVFGYRLLSEAIVIGVATAVATFLVYDVARRATDSTGRGGHRGLHAGGGGAARLRVPEADCVRRGGGAVVAIRVGAATMDGDRVGAVGGSGVLLATRPRRVRRCRSDAGDRCGARIPRAHGPSLHAGRLAAHCAGDTVSDLCLG